jgi:peptidyl-prolyl cis-trans isomerase SurA
MFEKSVRQLLSLGLLALLLVIGAPATAQVIDRVLVVVNDDVITEGEYIESMRSAMAELRARGAQIPERRVLEEQVMEQLILERIQLRIADRLGVVVSPEQVNRMIAEIASRQNMTPEQMIQQAARLGLSAQRYRQELEKQLRIQRLVEREVRRRVSISEAEIDERVAALAREDNTSNAEYEVAHISLLLDNAEDDDERARLLATAREIQAELGAGADFEALARRYSDSPTADDGGHLGWRPAAGLPDLFREAVTGLASGEVSDILDSPGGIHIVKLIGRRGGRSELVEQWRTRHILIPTGDGESTQVASETAARLRDRLMQGEDFAELARLHSSDSGSRANGGELGWVSPGDTVPDFEEAIRNLAIGQISEPVETRFGFHLIEVLDRRRHDIGDNRLRVQAQQQLQEEKGREAYEQWLRRIRDEAFVKFRVKPG